MNRSKYLWLVLLAVVIVTPIASDLFRGNYRWQMLPAISSSILLLLSIAVLKLKVESPLLFPCLIGLGIVGLLTSAILSELFPVFTFPLPTGKYTVGTTSIDLVDKSRIELCDPNTKSNRELVVQVWYPTTQTNGVKAAYLQDARLIPPGIFSHLGKVKTHAILDASIATTDAPYPVIIYTPSWSGSRTDNTFQTQELASHGFVVIGLEHPCSVPMAIYPNGRVIYSNLSADYTSSDEALATLLRVGEEQLVLRTQDIRFVLDRLPQINRSVTFKSTLDLDKIGIFGHSFGGAAAAQACSVDLRLKAGMNMDGLLFGSAARQGAAVPFLFMNSDYPRPTAADLSSTNGSLRRAKQTDAWGYEQRDRWFQQHGGYNLTLLESAHMNFSDYPLRSWLGSGCGKIPTDRAMKIINEYTVAFFDRVLKGKSSSLLERLSDSPFPEVVFEHHAQPRSPTAQSDRGSE